MDYPAQYLREVDALSMRLHKTPVLKLLKDPADAAKLIDLGANQKQSTKDTLRKIRLKQAAELWQELGDTPVNADGELEQKFWLFDIGTDREYIWDYFEEEFDLSVVEDLMFANVEVS